MAKEVMIEINGCAFSFSSPPAIIEAKSNTVCVFQDLGPHLKNPKTRRLLRDLIAAFKRDSRMMILLDHEAVLPNVILAHTRDFALSLPDEAEIREIAMAEKMQALRHWAQTRCVPAD